SSYFLTTFQIKVDDSSHITDSRFKTFGCGASIAASSVTSEWVKGETVSEVLTINNTANAKHLRLPPVKLHCSVLTEDAIKKKKAIADAAVA
ncbi:hypothetical protein HID58_061843, partial [Brassica napus]